MNVINDILSILLSIIKANILVIVIIVLSFIVERITGLKLFIDHFKWKKSAENARILTSGDSIYYFIITLIVYVYDAYKGNAPFNIYYFIMWLVLILILIKYLSKLHFKYQGKDPNKADDDYT